MREFPENYNRMKLKQFKSVATDVSSQITNKQIVPVLLLTLLAKQAM